MKQLFNSEDIERKVLLILKILNDSQKPVGSRVIARMMKDSGLELSERTIRYHLKFMDERGLTRLVGRKDGRVITAVGNEELINARVHDKTGLCISRIDLLAYKTTFDVSKKQGLVPINISFFSPDRLGRVLEGMKPAFKHKLAVCNRIAVAKEGEKLGEVIIPNGKIGLATICSIVINGVLLKNGIPIDSKFGGILQMKKGAPLRFVELIYYSGSSLDPSEIFIRGKMTSVRQVVEKGDGYILANFRELPAASISQVKDILAELKKIGIDGVLSMGGIGDFICQTAVAVNKAGMILIGGLNPVAGAYEQGIDVDNLAMSTVMEFQDMQSVWEM